MFVFFGFLFFFLSDPYTMHCEYDAHDSLIVSFISFFMSRLVYLDHFVSVIKF